MWFFFLSSVGFLSPFGMTCFFHFLFLSLTPVESVLWLKVSTPSDKSFWFLYRHVPPKKYNSSFLLFFHHNLMTFSIQVLTLVEGGKCLFFCFFFAVNSLTFQAAPSSSFYSLNEVEQCTANTSWFTFKKQNNKQDKNLVNKWLNVKSKNTRNPKNLK